jgi:hypothetical protein
MKALSSYSSFFSFWEEERRIAWGTTFKPKFKIESYWSDIEVYFDKVDRDDVIELLQKIKKSQVKIYNWSPFKLEGFHSLHLEKAMRYRHHNYDEDGMTNVSKAYATESLQAKKRSISAKETQDAITDWKSD